jgi:hypothetical protein
MLLRGGVSSDITVVPEEQRRLCRKRFQAHSRHKVASVLLIKSRSMSNGWSMSACFRYIVAKRFLVPERRTFFQGHPYREYGLNEAAFAAVEQRSR